MFFHAATQIFVEKIRGVCGSAALFAEKLCFSDCILKLPAATPPIQRKSGGIAAFGSKKNKNGEAKLRRK